MSSCPTRCVPLWSATTATGGSPGCWRRSTSTGSGSGRRPRATSSWKLSRSTPIEYGCATRRRPNMKRKQPTEPVPEGGGRVRRSWKKLALAAVALFVVFSVGRSVLPALGIGFPGGSKPGGPASTRAKNPPPPTVNLDGVMVPGSGQPLITLNPGLVRAGSTVAVNGSGFDPGSRVDLLLSSGKSQKAQQLATVTASKDGTIAGALPFPSEVSGGDTTREVTAQQRNSNKVAKAEAVLAQGHRRAERDAARRRRRVGGQGRGEGRYRPGRPQQHLHRREQERLGGERPVPDARPVPDDQRQAVRGEGGAAGGLLRQGIRPRRAGPPARQLGRRRTGRGPDHRRARHVRQRRVHGALRADRQAGAGVHRRAEPGHGHRRLLDPAVPAAGPSQHVRRAPRHRADLLRPGLRAGRGGARLRRAGPGQPG